MNRRNGRCGVPRGGVARHWKTSEPTMIHLDVESDRSHVMKSYPCRVRAQLGWWDGSGMVPAWIKKVSRGGATLETGHEPPDSAGLWVRIDAGPSSEWIEARIIAVEEVSAFP